MPTPGASHHRTRFPRFEEAADRPENVIARLPAVRLSANKLGLELRVPSNRIVAIASGKRAISADTALRLARYFNTTADFWMNLQTRYDLQQAEDQLADAIAREVRPRDAA